MSDGFRIADAFVEVHVKDSTKRGLADVKSAVAALGDRAGPVRVGVQLDSKGAAGQGALVGLLLGKKIDRNLKKTLGLGFKTTMLGLRASVVSIAPALSAFGLQFGVAAAAVHGTKDAVDAYSDALAAGDGDFSKYNELLAKMVPAQQEFTKQIIAMGPALEGLQRTAASSFLPGVTQMLKDSEVLFPIFDAAIRRTGSLMSDTSRELGNLFQTARFQRNLDGFLSSLDPVTKAAGRMIVNLTDRLIQFGAEMKPATLGFAGFLDGLSAGIEGFLDELVPYADDFKVLWESLGAVIEELGPIFGKLVGEIVSIVGPALKGLAEFLERNSDEIKALMPLVAGLVTALAGLKIIHSVTKFGRGIAELFTSIGVGAAAAGKKVDGLTGKLRRLAKMGLKGGLFAGGAMLGDQLTNNGESLNTIAGNPDAGPMPSIGESLSFLGQGEFSKAFGAPPADGTSWNDVRNWPTLIPQLSTQIGESVSTLKLNIGAWFMGIGDSIGTTTSNMRTSFTTSISGMVGDAQTWLGSLPGRVGAWFMGMWTSATTWMTNLGSSVALKAAEIVTGIATWFGSLPGRVGGWFRGIWQNAVVWLTNLATSAREKASQVVQGVVTWISQLPGRVATWFGQLPGRAMSALRALVPNVSSVFRNAVNTAVRFAGQLVTNAVNWLRQLPGRARSAISSLGSVVSGVVRGAANAALSGARSLLNGFVNTVRQLPGRARAAISGVGDAVRGALAGAGSWLVSAGRNIIQGLVNGISGMVGAVRRAVSSVVSAARRFLPFSPAKEGPLSGKGSPDRAGATFSRMLAEGITAEKGRVRSAISSVVGDGPAAPRGVGRGSAGPDLNRRMVDTLDRLSRTAGVTVNVMQTSGSPAETGRMVALGLRMVG